MKDLVVLKTFLYRHEAEMTKNILAEEGIETIISADDLGTCRPHLTFGLGGVKLLVKKENLKKSQKILESLKVGADDKEDREFKIIRLEEKTKGIKGLILVIIISGSLSLYILLKYLSNKEEFSAMFVILGVPLTLFFVFMMYYYQVVVKAKKELEQLKKKIK